uniref:Elongation of very long chain fatty acids protein n=1 Tax=Platynereis dumerilii TaxID=6359 RepID=A0AA96RS75_PLADU|nr:elongation of very long chain fatty acids protein elovl4-like [Platynereis dumerilii]
MDVLKDTAIHLWDDYQSAFQDGDKRVEDWFMMDAYWKTWAGSVLYLLIVWIGPKLMENREPMKLRYPIVIYNVLIVLLNFYIFYELLVCTTKRGYSYSCQLVDRSDNPYEVRIAKALWWFYFSKCMEFMDTFFFILRKKNTQITLLHVYHHASVFPLCWIGVKWHPGGQVFFGALMNSWTHVVMYSYYGLASMGPKVQKYLWWKRYITKMQLTQFVAGMVHGAQSISLGCPFPLWIQWTLFFYVGSMQALFWNFYFQAYIKPKHKLTKAEYTSSHIANGYSSQNKQALANGSEDNNGQALANGSRDNKKDMAENWLTSPLKDQDQVTVNAEDYDQISDETDETPAPRPKRTRNPSATDMCSFDKDSTFDPTSAEAPKQKRGRGRPKSKKDDDQDDTNQQLYLIRQELDNSYGDIDRLKREMETLVKENKKLASLLQENNKEKEEMELDLELTRSSLLEKECDYAELLDQFSQHEERTSAAPKPQGLVLFDGITVALLDCLPDTIEWKHMQKSLKDLKPNNMDMCQPFDLVLLMIGAEEIQDALAFPVFSDLKMIVEEACKFSEIYCTTLPPNNKNRLQVDLLIHKMLGSQIANSTMIKLKFTGSRSVWVTGDEMTHRCIRLYKEAIAATVSIPNELKGTASAASATASDESEAFEVSAIVPLKQSLFGRIIGKGGNVVKKLTDQHKVRMSFGMWSEERKEDGEVISGVLVRGLTKNVKSVTEEIKKITNYE